MDTGEVICIGNNIGTGNVSANGIDVDTTAVAGTVISTGFSIDVSPR